MQQQGFLAGAMPCPTNPPAPAGSSPWTGAVPADITAWAKKILNDPDTYPMFAEVRANIDGVAVVAQVQHHTTRGATGETGLCIRGISIFRDVAASTASTNAMAAPQAAIRAWQSQSSTLRAIELVFLGFVAVGTTFTIVHALMNAEEKR